MGLLAYRYRLRVLIAATVAGGVIAFLIAGMGGFVTVLDCAYIGGLTGIVKRRSRWVPPNKLFFFTSLVAGAVSGVAVVAALMILGAAAQPDLRLDQRQHQRPRRDHRPYPQHGRRRRAARA